MASKQICCYIPESLKLHVHVDTPEPLNMAMCDVNWCFLKYNHFIGAAEYIETYMHAVISLVSAAKIAVM